MMGAVPILSSPGDVERRLAVYIAYFTPGYKSSYFNTQV